MYSFSLFEMGRSCWEREGILGISQLPSSKLHESLLIPLPFVKTDATIQHLHIIGLVIPELFQQTLRITSH